jgi:hypothetical protein
VYFLSHCPHNFETKHFPDQQIFIPTSILAALHILYEYLGNEKVINQNFTVHRVEALLRE